MNAAPIPGTDSKICTFNPNILQAMTAIKAVLIITIECLDDGLYPDIRTMISGMNIPPNP